jgi:hypothetical protein
MERTGESYSTARRHVLRQVGPNKSIPWHFPGSVPGATALRSLLTAAGVRNPRSGEPLSESMVFGIAGGIGIGIFTFCYEKDDFASFFVAGRHRWHDNVAYLDLAAARFGAKAHIRETTGKAAEKALRDTLEDGPCIAWVDMANLPHRAMPEKWSGGGYHIVTVYKVENDTALIGDLTDEPISISLDALAKARGRIKKDKNRLLSIGKVSNPKDLAPLIREGLGACYRGLVGEGAVKAAKRNFSLDALPLWAERIGATSGRESWAQVFPRGHRLWSGLTSILQFVEYWGGGGLGRPLFAEFLTEAADAIGDARLKSLGNRYAEIGRAWTQLTETALPNDVTAFREARELYARIGEWTNSGGASDDIRSAWLRLDELTAQAKAKFPLSDVQCSALLADLQRQIRSLFEQESAAHVALGVVAGS